MKIIRTLLALSVLVGTLGLSTSPLWADGALSKVQLPGTNYCHMKFPAIREDTLFTDKPELKDAGTKDVIDFYGPCDHDPLGKEEIRRQREDHLDRFSGVKH
jgi:hypothetical protein